jgi:ubiquinone/menaquinone biosynthesis C-methylase UbiE
MEARLQQEVCMSLVSQFARSDGQPDYLVEFLDQLDSDAPIRAARVAVAERIAKPGDKVLDAGCGVGGATLVFLERVGPGGLVAGVDINSALIDVAARRAQARRGAQFQVADALAIPYPSGFFDAAYCERVFLYLPNRLAALQELRRVVKPGGSICLVDADIDAMAIYSTRPELTRKLTSTVAAAIPNPNSARELPALARLAGLDKMQAETFAVRVPYQFMAHAIGGVLQQAVQRGVVDKAEFDEWWDEQARLQESGDFFFAWMAVRIFGTVPEQA